MVDGGHQEVLSQAVNTPVVIATSFICDCYQQNRSQKNATLNNFYVSIPCQPHLAPTVFLRQSLIELSLMA